jgi:Rps23 Pro-64 3,4-dihydroxylase Tpa1-like proline 4-hydroxylase
MRNLWKSVSLSPSDKISTRTQNKISLNILLAGVLVREYSKNYFLELSKIPLNYLNLIISNIILGDNIDWNNGIWNDFKSWISLRNQVKKQIESKEQFQRVLKKKWKKLLRNGSFKIEDSLTNSKKDEMIKLARRKNGLAKGAHFFVNPGCIVDQNDKTLIHLENIDDQNALLQAITAVNEYYFHLIGKGDKDKESQLHRSKDFWSKFIEHFGAFRRFKSFPYVTASTASSHSTAHQICVDNLLRNLVPLSKYVNKFIQDNYENMYSKLINLSWGPFAPRPFGFFPTIAINFNTISDYHWDELDAPNCLCCLVPLGNDFQGGELYFPQLHTLVPLRPGQVVAFTSHFLLHGNFPLTRGIRHSIVYFIHNTFFQSKDNIGDMEIIDTSLDKKLYSNHGFNPKRNDYKTPQNSQTDMPKANNDKRRGYIGK